MFEPGTYDIFISVLDSDNPVVAAANPMRLVVADDSCQNVALEFSQDLKDSFNALSAYSFGGSLVF